MVDQQISLHTGRFFELTVDLGRRQLALLERHLVERWLGALADAEGPARVRLVAGSRERVVQPTAEVLGRQ